MTEPRLPEYYRAKPTRRKYTRDALLAGTALVGVLAFTPDAWAQAIVFEGPGTDWHTATNWDANPTAVPSATDDTIIGDTTSPMTAIIDNNTANANRLHLGTATAASYGALNVLNGGSLTVGTIGGRSLIVGNEGQGVLNIGSLSAGASVTSDNSRVGELAGANGAVTARGTSNADRGTWTINGSLTVGDAGTGTLNIRDFGRVTTSVAGAIGNQDGSNGEASVAGTEAEWINSGNLHVGVEGTGILSVTNGGSVSTNGLILGANAVADIRGNGTLIVRDADSFVETLTGTFDVGQGGDGSMAVRDGGMVVSGSGATIGSDAGSTGDVIVQGTGSQWFVNNGDLYLGDAGRANLDILLGGLVTVGGGAGTVRIADQGGAEGTLTVGGTGAAAAAGTLAAGTVQFGDGTGLLIFNHTGTNHLFSADITATTLTPDALIRHDAGTTQLAGDGSGYFGATQVNGGWLYVNNALGGTVAVNNGGTLGGSGNVGAVTVNSGGMLAPGNSIGTLNVATITFNAGSTYEVELNDGGFVAGTNNDLINATGTVNIDSGASVHVTPENGTDDGSTYLPGTYTIITTTSGVNGTFDPTVTDDFAFLAFTLDYDTQNVYLISSLDPTGPCNALTLTFNQGETCGGVFSVGSGTVYSAVLALSNAEAPVALDLLSGEIHASARTTLLQDSRFAREAALGRLRNALNGAGARGQMEQDDSKGVTLWGHAFGSWGHWNSDGNAARMDRDTGGFLLGADGKVLDNVHLGALAGYSRTSLNIGDRTSSGTVDTYTLGAYAGGAWDAFSLKGGVAHSWHSLDVNRSVTFTGFSDQLSASYNARTLQAYTEAAYNIETGNVRVEPFANLASVHLNADGYSETGGAAALTGSGSSGTATFTTLGIRGETQADLGGLDATLLGGLGWRHAFGDTPNATHAFAGGNAFTVAGVPRARDRLVLDAGFEVNFAENATFSLSYNGQVGSDLSDHGAKASINISF